MGECSSTPAVKPLLVVKKNPGPEATRPSPVQKRDAEAQVVYTTDRHRPPLRRMESRNTIDGLNLSLMRNTAISQMNMVLSTDTDLQISIIHPPKSQIRDYLAPKGMNLSNQSSLSQLKNSLFRGISERCVADSENQRNSSVEMKLHRRRPFKTTIESKGKLKLLPPTIAEEYQERFFTNTNQRKDNQSPSIRRLKDVIISRDRPDSSDSRRKSYVLRRRSSVEPAESLGKLSHTESRVAVDRTSSDKIFHFHNQNQTLTDQESIIRPQNNSLLRYSKGNSFDHRVSDSRNSTSGLSTKGRPQKSSFPLVIKKGSMKTKKSRKETDFEKCRRELLIKGDQSPNPRPLAMIFVNDCFVSSKY